MKAKGTRPANTSNHERMNGSMKHNQTLTSTTVFEPNAFYEKVLDLRRTSPSAFDSLAPATKQSLHAYETAKREAQRLQALRDEPEAA